MPFTLQTIVSTANAQLFPSPRLQWLFDRLNACTNVVTDTVVAKVRTLHGSFAVMCSGL